MSHRQLFANNSSLLFVLLIAFFQSSPKNHGHRWGSQQRPIYKLKALRSLKAPVSSTRSNKAHAELRLLYQSVNTIPRYLNVFTCCSVYPLTCRIHCLGRLERHDTSIFLVLIFDPTWSYASENRSNASWSPCWEGPRMQYQFVVCQKQTFHPGVPSSDTLVDASVIVYQFHTDQSSPHILGEDHISCCTAVRGPEILLNVFF